MKPYLIHTKAVNKLLPSYLVDTDSYNVQQQPTENQSLTQNQKPKFRSLPLCLLAKQD